MGGGKKTRLGQSWSSHDAHTIAHATLVGHRGSVGVMLGPTTELVPSTGAIVPVMILEGQQNALHWGWINIYWVYL